MYVVYNMQSTGHLDLGHLILIPMFTLCALGKLCEANNFVIIGSGYD